VRIQTERGHVAVTDGPYRTVRHPGYLGMSTSMLGSVFLLDSRWGLVCFALYMALVITRTALEDRTLPTELPGYAAYMTRTRYRLIPGFRRIFMKLSLGMKSILLFVLAIVFLILLTLFETSLAGLAMTTERIISLLLLVLPGVIGVVYGVLSIVRKEPKTWIAYLGILLNALFVLFQLFVISFAG